MNKTALLLGVGASLLLAAGAANAGTCTTEIQALQAQMGVQSPAPSSDLSSDSTTTMDSDTTATADSDADATAGAADPSVEQPDASGGTMVQNDSSSGTGTTDGSGTIAPEGDNSADATAGAAEPSVEQPDASASGEATADAEQPTDLGTPSPDVTETSRTGEVGTNAEALAALERAQNYDKAGDEEACMTEVDAAKQALGIQ